MKYPKQIRTDSLAMEKNSIVEPRFDIRRLFFGVHFITAFPLQSAYRKILAKYWRRIQPNIFTEPNYKTVQNRYRRSPVSDIREIGQVDRVQIGIVGS